MSLSQNDLTSEEKSLHQSLTDIMVCLNYPVFKDGVCEGAAVMGMQTFFSCRGETTRLAPLLKRLDFLHELDKKYGSKGAAKYLTDIQQSIGIKPALNETEQLIIDCFAMMDGILLHLRPDLFPELFDRILVQGQTDVILPYTASIALERECLPQQVASIINMFDENEFKNYMSQVNDALSEINEDVVLMLQTANHTIDLMYDAKTNKYCIFDITNCQNMDFLDLAFDPEHLPAILFLLFSSDEDLEEDEDEDEDATVDTDKIPGGKIEDFIPAQPELTSIPMQIAIHLGHKEKDYATILKKHHLYSKLDELADKSSRIGVNNATLAYIAAQNGDIELIRTLVKCNVNLNITLKDDGSSVAYIAASNNHPDIIKELINADVNAITKQGFTPAYVAAQYNYVDVLIALKSSGANLDLKNKNEKGATPLMVAASKNNLKALETLLKLGANLDIVDNNGLTALYHAIANNKTETALALIETGARLDLGDNERITPLLLAAMQGNQIIIEACLRAGADLYSHSKNHKNLAHFAAGNNNLALLKMLAQVKFPWENKTASGFTPLDLAIFNKNIEAVAIILPQVNPTYETLVKLQNMSKDSPAITDLLEKKINDSGFNENIRDRINKRKYNPKQQMS